jgi:nitrilase
MKAAAVQMTSTRAVRQKLAEAAEKHAIWLVGGTIPIRDAGAERASQRSLLFGPDGREAARYDKIHLFDVDIPGREAERYLESAASAPGTRVVSVATPLARVGMTVCYDIRFPALFHRLSVLGTEVLVVPAAFTVPTGEVHWQPLLQARAIESLVYVVASGQTGEHAGGRKTYGHSMIVGPWGEILGELPAGPGVVCADLDMIRLTQLRQKFPVVTHRREL